VLEQFSPNQLAGYPNHNLLEVYVGAYRGDLKLLLHR